MITSIWEFTVTQFRFSQSGVSQSWLFWTVILGVMVVKNVLRNGYSKEK